MTDKTAATVTLPVRDSRTLSQSLSDQGLLVQPIALRGRYHHPCHSEMVRSLQAICERDERFQLAATDALLLRLRSNADAEPIQQGFLHDIALTSILSEPCRWFQAVDAAVESMQPGNNNNIEIVPVGTESFIPRSVMMTRINNISPGHNGFERLSTLSEGASKFGPSAIAIVGMACRYPDADSVEEFWELINSGRCTVQPLPKDRFQTSELWREPKGPFWGNFLRRPDAFDHRFFGISGREAKSMDPQQRLLLQVAYEAVESSGYRGARRTDLPRDVGCYIGVGSVDYGDNVTSQHASAFSAVGTLRAFISGRVSHYFGWTGPSITFDTACSSAAVAIHSACRVSIKTY